MSFTLKLFNERNNDGSYASKLSTDGVIVSMMFLGALRKEESLETIWPDY